MSKPAQRLSALDTALYGISIGVGIRWIAVAAAAGLESLPMWGLALLTFFVPLAAATAELTARVEGEGGIYAWTRDIIGPFAGFMCGWFYWISLIPYFAGILVFIGNLAIASTGGDVASAPLYIAIAFAVSALVTAVHLGGLKYGKWLPNLGTAGLWIVIAVIIGIALMLLARGQSATSFAGASYLPDMTGDTALLWGTMVFGFCGIESLAFLRNEIAGGVRTIIRALAVVGVTAIVVFVLGTAAFLVILPETELTRLAGFADALRAGLAQIGFDELGPFVVGLFALSMLGGFTAWFGVGARLPFAAGIDAYLPPVFARRDPRTGAPVASILLQCAMMLVMVLLSQAGTTVAGAYDFLMAMSILTVTIPYVFMFIVYLRASSLSPMSGAWRPPGGARMSRALALIGLVSTIVAIVCSLIPSSTETQPLAAFLKIVLATVLMFAVGALIFLKKTLKNGTSF